MATMGKRLREITIGFREGNALPRIELTDELPLWPQGNGCSVLPSRVDLMHLCLEYEEEMRIKIPFEKVLKAKTFGAMVKLVTKLSYNGGDDE